MLCPVCYIDPYVIWRTTYHLVVKQCRFVVTFVNVIIELPIKMRDINDNKDYAAWLLKLGKLPIDPALLDSNIDLPDSINRNIYIFILYNTYTTLVKSAFWNVFATNTICIYAYQQTTFIIELRNLIKTNSLKNKVQRLSFFIYVIILLMSTCIIIHV